MSMVKAAGEAKKSDVPAFLPNLLEPLHTRPQAKRNWLESGGKKLHPEPPGSNSGHNFGQVLVHSGSKAVTAPQSCPLVAAGPTFCPFGGACHTCPVKVQAKLDRDQPGDVFEQEADRVAAKVMNGGGDPGLQQRLDAVKISHVSPMIQRQVAGP